LGTGLGAGAVVCVGAGRDGTVTAGCGDALATGFGDGLGEVFGDGEGESSGLGDSATSDGEASTEGEAAAATTAGDGDAVCFAGLDNAPTSPRPPQHRTKNPATDARTISRTLLDFFGAVGTGNGMVGSDMTPPWVVISWLS
jgi:hypothetical protein